MKKVILSIIFLVAFIAMIPGAGFALLSITTGAGVNEGIVDQGGSAFLTNGCTVEIILLPIGETTAQAPNILGEPTGGDVRIGVTSIGTGVFLLDGAFSDDFMQPIGRNIYCRAWNSSSISTATYYGNSETLVNVAPGVAVSWDINGSTNINAFATNVPFISTPPGPPSGILATQEISGDIIVSWTKTTDASAVGTRLVYKTGGYPTGPTDGTQVNVLVGASSQAVRATGLTSGTVYYFSAFTYDSGSNFSSSVNISQTALDSLAPTIESTGPANGTQNVQASLGYIDITFDGSMDQALTFAAFNIDPGVTLTPFWQQSGKLLRLQVSGSLAQQTTYVCTVDTGARDLAGNPLTSDYTFSFRTALGAPPLISNLKIDGWKKFPGDIISPHPKIESVFNHPTLGPSGIASIEIIANSVSYMFNGTSLADVYNSTTGDLNVRFPSKLPEGTYSITIKGYDIYGNSTEESVTGLVVMSGATKLIGPVVNYPNPFGSGDGTTFAYTLTIDSDIEFYIYNIAGVTVYTKKVLAGTPGAIAGYNEFYWNGLTNSGQGIGSGMFLVKVAAGDKVIASFKVIMVNYR